MKLLLFLIVALAAVVSVCHGQGNVIICTNQLKTELHWATLEEETDTRNTYACWAHERYFSCVETALNAMVDMEFRESQLRQLEISRRQMRMRCDQYTNGSGK